MFSVGWHAVEITTSASRRGGGLGTGTSPPQHPAGPEGGRGLAQLTAHSHSPSLRHAFRRNRRRQALPCVCPAEPSGQQAGQADRTVRPAWLEAYMTRWPGRLSVCKGAAAALAAGRTRRCTAQVCTPGGCHGWSRCPFTGTQSRHPHCPPPRLGPRCSKEAAITTSQIHSPGGDITSRELSSGTGQLNAFT